MNDCCCQFSFLKVQSSCLLHLELFWVDPILLLRYACLGVLFSDLITKDKVQKIAFQMLYNNRALSHTYVLFDAIGHLIFNHITFVHTFFIVEKKEQHSSFFLQRYHHFPNIHTQQEQTRIKVKLISKTGTDFQIVS